MQMYFDISDKKFIVSTDDVHNDDTQYISVKQIRNYCKALETLGFKVVKIKANVSIDEDTNKHLTEEDCQKINNLWNTYSTEEIEIISNKKIKCKDYIIKVNKDESYDYEGKHYIYVKSPIKEIEIYWSKR